MTKIIYAYRAQQQGYGHPFTIIMSRKVRKEAKPHGENLCVTMLRIDVLEYIKPTHNLG